GCLLQPHPGTARGVLARSLRQAPDPGTRDTRRSRDATERRRHPPIASPSPASTISRSAFTASSASSPSAVMRMAWPCDTPRPSTPSMLLAAADLSASRVKLVTRISDLKPVAALTNVAAGRACNPDGLRSSTVVSAIASNCLLCPQPALGPAAQPLDVVGVRERDHHCCCRGISHCRDRTRPGRSEDTGGDRSQERAGDRTQADVPPA